MNIIETLTGTTATMGERIEAAAYVSVVGVAVVFVVLVVLVVMVSILKRVDEAFTKKEDTGTDAGGSVSTTSTASSGVDPKVVAVISAAVAAVLSAQGTQDIVMPGMIDSDTTWKLESRTINHNNHMPKA